VFLIEERHPPPNYRTIPIEKKLQEFVSTQAKKIPLIFKKWSLLRKYLNVVAVHNFEYILFAGQEMSYISQDITRDYDLVKDLWPMHALNNQVTQRVLKVGIKTVKGLMEGITKNNSNLSNIINLEIHDIKDIKKICDEWKRVIEFRRNFVDIATSVDTIFKQMNKKSNSVLSFESDVSYEGTDENPSLETLEKAFEAEVTLTYYLSLLESSHDISLVKEQLLEPWEIQDGQIEVSVPNQRISLSAFSPRIRLKVILSEDTEISDFVIAYLEDSIKYHRLEFENIKRLSGSIISDTS
jgi:hypothetical protein